jgi:hypothetical protein
MGEGSYSAIYFRKKESPCKIDLPSTLRIKKPRIPKIFFRPRQMYFTAEQRVLCIDHVIVFKGYNSRRNLQHKAFLIRDPW